MHNSNTDVPLSLLELISPSDLLLFDLVYAKPWRLLNPDGNLEHYHNVIICSLSLVDIY